MTPEELVRTHLPLLRRVAAQQRRPRMLPMYELEDLAQMGFRGLVQASERFDPAVGVKFSTFAYRRIRGAIIDELRRRDWVPRQVRASGEETPIIGSLSWPAPTPNGMDGDVLEVGDLIEGPAAPLDEGLERADLHAALRRLLDERELTVIVGSYFRGLRLAVVADEMGLTESRVCQIRQKALAKLRLGLPRLGIAA